MAFSFAQSTFFSKPSLFLHKNGFGSFAFSLSFSPRFSTSADKIPHHKLRQQPVTAAVLELGGVKIAKDGNLPTFQNCIFRDFDISSDFFFHCFLSTVCNENPVSDGYLCLPSWFVIIIIIFGDWNVQMWWGMTRQTMFRIRYSPNLECNFIGGTIIQLGFWRTRYTTTLTLLTRTNMTSSMISAQLCPLNRYHLWLT